jgi:hypothetical protein
MDLFHPLPQTGLTQGEYERRPIRINDRMQVLKPARTAPVDHLPVHHAPLTASVSGPFTFKYVSHPVVSVFPCRETYTNHTNYKRWMTRKSSNFERVITPHFVTDLLASVSLARHSDNQDSSDGAGFEPAERSFSLCKCLSPRK